MRGRKVTAGLFTVLLVWCTAAGAQQAEGAPKIAMLTAYSESDGAVQSGFPILIERLKQRGIAGSNARLTVRWGDADANKLKQYAAELIALHPAVLVTETTAATRAVLRQTQTLPTVFVRVTDPIKSGFVSSLAAPGGNSTGFTDSEPSIGGKWLEILRELSPRLTRVGAVFNPKTHSGTYWATLDAAAQSIGIELRKVPVERLDDLDAIVREWSEPGSALIVMPDPFTITNREAIVNLVEKYRALAIYPYRFFAESGGLVSYGVAFDRYYENAADYVERVMKGEKPANLAVQHPTKYELILNLKTAKAFGLEIPASYLARADDVIE